MINSANPGGLAPQALQPRPETKPVALQILTPANDQVHWAEQAMQAFNRRYHEERS